MKTISLVWMTLAALALLGCQHVDPAAGGGASETLGSPMEEQTDPDDPEEVVYEYDAVDVMLVVDNSGSMQEEQQMLATAVFTLVSALTDPLPGWTYPPVDDVRIGIVSSDMGLQWGGQPYQAGDGWPGDTPTGCSAVGDDGQLQTYPASNSINLQPGEIPCGADASQCPSGWTCEDVGEDGIGRCQPTDDPTGLIPCPTLDGEFSETTPDATNEALSEQVACLSDLGTNGCGFEQQIVAGVRGAEVGDGTFIRDQALMAVMVISDEDDCSIESNALFGEPEIQNLADGKVNLACGMHDDHLYSPEALRQRMLDVKGGDDQAVVFAALAGVPQDPSCEGAGHMVGSCLLHPAMTNTVVMENDASFFVPACERYAGDELITKARPGRRFVRTVQEFQEYGFVFSICHDDWVPVMDSFARLILRAMWAPDEVDDSEDPDEAIACSTGGAVGVTNGRGLLDVLGLLIE